VRRHTPARSLDDIDNQTRLNISHFAMQPRRRLDERIEELEREWDIERVLETNASLLALTGLVLGATVNRKWLLLTGGVLGFLAQHGISGWCPPLPMFRKIGIRTRREIDQERFALKALRGDFDATSVARQDKGVDLQVAAVWRAVDLERK
jgi:hypothetical protein